MLEPTVKAEAFESREIYRSSKSPGYAAWTAFFPGEAGQWYVTCEEVTRPEIPLPGVNRDQWYMMGLPEGYDKSRYQLEMVILESRDALRNWRVISRQAGRFQHSAGSIGQARTRDGRFLRFVWQLYSLDPDAHPGEILLTSSDDGKTWERQPALYDRRFATYPHRLRMLRDGTFVLALPFGRSFDAYHPRLCTNLNADTEMQMTLCFSYDQGYTWSSPLPIYGGQAVAETDFAELPSGDLVCVNNSIFAHPGRQIVYRTDKGFLPGPFERALTPELVPETVCLTEDGLLVGCMRAPWYAWSDDLGLSWQRLEGIPDAIINWRQAGERGGEVYQPWIQYLGDGRIACSGHYGGDDPIEKSYTNYLMLHLFTLDLMQRTKNTHIDLVRDYDEASGRWCNAYTLTLTCDGQPLAGKALEFWYVERDKPGYDSTNKDTLADRMRMGGQTIVAVTGADGTAHVSLPQLECIDYIHHAIQIVVRFNADRSDHAFKPTQTDQYEFYTIQQFKGH